MIAGKMTGERRSEVCDPLGREMNKEELLAMFMHRSVLEDFGPMVAKNCGIPAGRRRTRGRRTYSCRCNTRACLAPNLQKTETIGTAIMVLATTTSCGTILLRKSLGQVLGDLIHLGENIQRIGVDHLLNVWSGSDGSEHCTTILNLDGSQGPEQPIHLLLMRISRTTLQR